VEKLVSHLVRAPISRSGGHEFESPVRQELGALTKSGKTLVIRSFYRTLNWTCVQYPVATSQ
jgi:hypothetical protein